MVEELADRTTAFQNSSEEKGMAEDTEEQVNTSQSKAEEKETDMDFAEKITDYAKEQSDKANVYIQYRIYNNHGVITGDGAEVESIRFDSVDKPVRKHWRGSVFGDKDGLANWLTKNYASYSMALMIATAAFDSLPYTWVIRAAEKLYETFPSQTEESNVFAQEEILHQFEAEICKGELNTYTGTTPIDIVRLNNPAHRETILKYVWQQYPQLQDKIISWMRSHIVQRQVILSKRALETMSFFACEDYYYFLNKMVPWISHDKSRSTDMMVGQILINLNYREEYEKNVYNLLHVWSKENRPHNLLVALFVCAQSSDKNDILECIVKNYIEGTLKEIRKGVLLVYRSGLYDFMGAGIRSFTFYRLLIEKLEDEVNKQTSLRERWDVYRLFLSLFAIDISLSRPKNGDETILIKLCMVKHAISDRLCSLWRMIWQCMHYRQLVYELMAQYEAKTKDVDSKYSVERFVDKVLGDVYSREMRQDICDKIHRRARNA